MRRTGTTKRHAPRGLGAFAPIVPAPWLIRASGSHGPSDADVSADAAGAVAMAKGSADPSHGAPAAVSPAFSRNSRPA
jgi:hypothetical protein